MSGGEEVYAPETGEFLGWAYAAEDGAQVLIDEAGEIVAAVDTEGNPLDPAGYTTADDDTGETDDLRGQIEELREWSENFDPAAIREEARAMGEQASGHLAEQAWAQAITHEMKTVEARIGRPLTAGEQWRLMEESHSDLEAGVPSEGGIWEHVERAQLTPFSPGMGDNDAGRAERRQQYMAELVGDSEREERGDNPGEKPWHDPASNDEHDQRVAFMMNTIDHPEED